MDNTGDKDSKAGNRKVVFITTTLIVLIIPVVVLNLSINKHHTALAAIIFQLGLVFNYFFYRKNKQYFIWGTNSLIFYTILTAYITYDGGTDKAAILWSFLFPLIAFEIKGHIKGLNYCFIYYFIISLIFILSLFDVFPSVYSLQYMVVFFIVSTATTTISFYFIKQRAMSEYNSKLNEEKFKMLTENTSAGIYMLRGSSYIFVNNSLSQIFKYQKETLLSFNQFEPIHPDFREVVADRAARRQKGESVPDRYEIKIIAGDGTIKWIDIYSKLISIEGFPTIIGTVYDITDRKDAEEKLRESQEKYKLLTEFSSDVIWVLNLSFNKFTYISSAITQLRGITVEQALKQKIEDSMTPESLVTINHVLKQNLYLFQQSPNNSKTYTLEIQQPHKDGHLIWVEIATKLRYNKNGEIEVVGVSRNIDKRKQIEHDLKYNLQMQELVFAISSLFVSSSNNYINNKLYQALYLSGEFFQADRCSFFRFKDQMAYFYLDTQWCRDDIKQIISLNQIFDSASFPWWIEQLNKNTAIITSDINMLPKEASLEKEALQILGIKSVVTLPIHIQDKIIGFFGFDFIKQKADFTQDQVSMMRLISNILADVIEKDIAETALNESLKASKQMAARYKAFIDATNTGAWEYNGETGHLWCSSHYFSMLGRNPLNYQSDKIANAEAIWEALIHPNDYPKALENFKKYLQHPNDTYQQVYRMKHINGNYLWVLSRGQAIPNENEKILPIVIGTHIDITDQKHFEQTIIEKNKELEAYLYVTSHDLRSPLVNIQGFSSRLEKQTLNLLQQIESNNLPNNQTEPMLDILNNKIPQSLNYIFSSVRKMDSLINGLLLISRTGRIKLNPVSIDMDQLISKIIAAHKFQLDEIHAEINFSPLPPCFGDENLINQLFSNLIDNAIKYRKQNAPFQLSVSGNSNNDTSTYSVCDNGVGISEHNLKKIWDVFYRVDPKISTSGEGIGLNLAMKIIEKHKGKIWAQSEFGKGSCFFIQLNNHTSN